MRFSIRKALLILAVYAGLLALFRTAGWPGCVAALVSGTALSLIILYARGKDALPMIRIGICTLAGALLIGCCCGTATLPLDARVSGSLDFLGGWGYVGAVAGGAVGAFWNLSYRKRRTRDRAKNDRGA